MALLRFENLSFAYPEAGKRALHHISFTMQEGEYLVVCGESGCGKTTLLRMAKPEMTPAGACEGKVCYRERPLMTMGREASARQIGYVQQNPDNQIVTDYVWHEMAFGLENMALPTQRIRRRVSEMASFFGMEDWFHKKTRELSGGQKQMLNLASILVMDPELLILDEPTSMLDPLAAENLLSMIHRINRELGVAVLLCEHRLEEVFQSADRMLLMHEGRIVEEDTPDGILKKIPKRPDSSRIFYGLPGAVRIFGELQNRGLYPEKERIPCSIREAREAFQKLEPDSAYVVRQLPVHKKSEKPLIQAKELWFRYERKGSDILRSADLTLYSGEIVSLLGGNGAGKSTFLKMLAGLLKPQRGKITRKEGLRMAMLPQSPKALFHYDTVWEEFLESAGIGQEEKDAADRALRMADFLELSEKLRSHPYDLSGGEMQRAALGKLLLQKAELLLLDEPTKGLDTYLKKTLAGYLKKLADQGISILLVTHDLEFAASYSDRCGLLFDGQVISEDEPHSFFSGNRFYTTAASRIAGEQIQQVITCEEVIEACESGRQERGT